MYKTKYKIPVWSIYLLIVTVVSSLLFIIFKAGHQLELSRGFAVVKASQINSINFSDIFHFQDSLSVLLLQIIVILVFSRILVWVMSLISQPTVIGEIIAGIMLGPSLLGLFYPEISSVLFPPASLSNLQFLSQIGLILFMFIIGMELDIGVIRQRAKAAVIISNVSIIVPYLLGVGLAFFLYTEYAPPTADFISFALFMGIAMSITAFPVLARIVQEKGMTRSPLGMIVITSAAIDDISAWTLLAVVVAIANSTAVTGAIFTILLSVIYVLLMLLIVRPVLSRIASEYTVHETVSKTIVAGVFGMMLISAFITEIIGIHALFGAFMAGVIMPDSVRFKHIMSEKMEDVSLVLLLPLFFVFTGLRTEIGLLNDHKSWITAALVILVAVTGKFAGGAIASRFTGQSWKNSLIIGALMNTRGLIELVALNIGYDIGILSPEIFTILVLMALITTFMTGPAMSLINYVFKPKESLATVSGLFRVLISFGPAESGARLLNLVSQLFNQEKDHLSITALHLTPNTEILKESAARFEEQAFSKINEIASIKGIDLKTEYRTTQAVSQEITRTANKGKYNLLVVGSSRPLLGSDKTGGKARYFFENVKSDVALVVDNGFADIKRVLIICMDESSREYMNTITNHFNPGIKTDTECLSDGLSLAVDYTAFDLIITGVECFRSQRGRNAAWTTGPVSIMIFSQYE